MAHHSPLPASIVAAAAKTVGAVLALGVVYPAVATTVGHLRLFH
jgi:hypothetical protein